MGIVPPSRSQSEGWERTGYRNAVSPAPETEVHSRMLLYDTAGYNNLGQTLGLLPSNDGLGQLASFAGQFKLIMATMN